jgi:pilus assembly protein Flp/PilA
MFHPVPDGPDSNGRILAMQNLKSRVYRFLASEDGPTAVEYAVMLALIVAVCATAISSLGTSASTKFAAVSTTIATNGS